ncbi:putative quinol monooxygenase [Geodermatophilus sp. DSM 44513]|uniref:putative quinol monooxygenase n=1 Tax=Geodermatophilus sp. DSM 44513 TaxID=1528104 RepID=UPI00128AD826|nr:putative quinol monooxygenase [Geodermatophilus sp. DSM 44513]WNV76344.1 putative quinol monooxygenase [Geodermatophilus sp. DSM 44513]
MSVVVIATIAPESEHADAVREALLASVPAVHGERGCLLYALHEAEDALVVVERWEDAAARQEHLEGDAFAELGRQLEGRMTRPAELRVLTPLPAGEDAKGVL